MEKGEVIALIVAGGSGKRMGGRVKKQFIELLGQPIVIRTIKRFEMMECVDYIYLVLPQDEMEFFKMEMLPRYLQGVKKLKALIKGGKERFFSVYNGLKLLANQSFSQKTKVLIHDGVRPLVDEQLVKRLLTAVAEKVGSVPGISVKDTIRPIDEKGYLEGYLDRNKLRALQTPQCFYLYEIYEAFKEVIKKNFVPTDDTAVFLSMGYNVKVVEGSKFNIKITEPDDLLLAENYLQIERDFYNVY